MRPDSDVSSDSGYLSLLNSLPSRLSPQCAVKEVSQEDIDMALFGFTSSVPVARKEIRRLALWAAGDIEALVKEGRAIQKHLPKRFGKRQEEQLSRCFANLMFLGKTQEALDLLSQFFT